jgi:hypothetical protein
MVEFYFATENPLRYTGFVFVMKKLIQNLENAAETNS